MLKQVYSIGVFIIFATYFFYSLDITLDIHPVDSCFKIDALIDKALFRSDTIDVSKLKLPNNSYYRRVVEMKWLIRGDTLHYGGDQISVQIHENRIDTILYWAHNDVISPDTLICYINQPKRYLFRWNTCCGGFDAVDEVDNVRYGIILDFQARSRYDEIKYLGRIEYAAVEIRDSSKNVVRGICRSAMKPNIYKVQIEEFTECEDLPNCQEIFCFSNGPNLPDSLQYTYEKKYSLINVRDSFLFLALSPDTLQVYFDPKTNRARLLPKVDLSDKRD